MSVTERADVFARLTRTARRALARSLPPPAAVNHTYRDAIVQSGLFDTEFYARQAGLEPSTSVCVDHYLAGRLAGACANRLFDGPAYLARHPDVAAAGMDPFVHFVAFGLSEGRQNSVPPGYLAEIAAIGSDRLAGLRVSNQAAASGWHRGSASRWAGRTVAVYASSLGNFFFRHIADRVADGLRAGGSRVHRLDQNGARPLDTDVDFFIAPHEFFRLGAGGERRGHPGSRPVILNTEQPGTHWYFTGLSHIDSVATVLDLSPQSAAILRDAGRRQSGYFPIGRLPPALRCEVEGTAGVLEDLRATCGLDPAAFRATGVPWSERPIDVLFLGTLTPRRSRALGALAATLARYRCFIHAPTGAGKPLVGGRRDLAISHSLMLARNAKVMLNIHRDEFPYFEWHRVMMLGIEHGAVVLSEPSLPSPGIDPTRHLITADVAAMPAVLRDLLESPAGAHAAEEIGRLAAGELRARFDLREELSALAFLHDTEFAGHA